MLVVKTSLWGTAGQTLATGLLAITSSWSKFVLVMPRSFQHCTVKLTFCVVCTLRKREVSLSSWQSRCLLIWGSPVALLPVSSV